MKIKELSCRWVRNFGLKKAVRSHEVLAEKETPVTLLEAAHKKLNHKDMDLSTMKVGDYDKARQLARLIQVRASDLESEIYQLRKNFKKLTNQGK